MFKCMNSVADFRICIFLPLQINTETKFIPLEPSNVHTGVPITSSVTSFLFQCNLFKQIVNGDQISAAQCLVCKQQGMIRYFKGTTTSNYHLHMKVKIELMWHFWPILEIKRVSNESSTISAKTYERV